MKKLSASVISVLLVSISASEPASRAAQPDRGSESLHVYQVNKKVCDYPEEEDLSTPEAAYATANRLCASGEQNWRRISVRTLAERMPVQEGKRKVSKTAAHGWLNAEILEVRTLAGTCAGVMAKIPHVWKNIIDVRILELEDGRWLNAGNSVFGSLEEARKEIDIACGMQMKMPDRPEIDDPDAHLKSFVEFLEGNAEDPTAFVLRALATYKVTIMAETHHRPRYWAFNSALVMTNDFPRYAGTIYMELPSNNQGLVDEFLAKETCDRKLIIEVLRDMLWMGWPDKPMLDFFTAVWNTNQNLEPEQRLRILLVDMERPWEKIRNRGDWRRYDVDRDRYMAENIVRDIQEHPNETRNTLFIVGVGHTGLNFEFYGGHPLKTAGWYLREKLGAESVYAIFQHRCAMTNVGRVDGRLCLGLFDSAFEAIGNKPIAFTLENGPFGQQPYDAQPDVHVWSSYGDGFSAYLYLGPLEDEIFSPLIDGFYTDEFVKELERRYRLMYGKGWAESYGREKSDAESFVDWMSGSGGSWGNPRKWRNRLGPIDVWKYGDNWEQQIQQAKHKSALHQPEETREAAQELFDKLREADYDSFLTSEAKVANWHKFPTVGRYTAHKWHDALVGWICRTFRENPIESVRIGDVFENKAGLPAVSYEITLRDGRKLEGVLPFRYSPKESCWYGLEGIDWHLQCPDSSDSHPVPQAKSPGKADIEAAPTLPIAESTSVDRSSPEATVISFTKAAATGNVEDALACMLPGGVDYEDVKEILNAEPESPKFFIRKMWQSIDIDKPIHILGKQSIEDELSIGWQFHFKEQFTIEGHTFQRGDTFELDATLKQHGRYWLIDNI